MAQRQQPLRPAIGKISINFPRDLWKALKMRALQDDETVTAILVRLAQNYLAEKKKKG